MPKMKKIKIISNCKPKRKNQINSKKYKNSITMRQNKKFRNYNKTL